MNVLSDRGTVFHLRFRDSTPSGRIDDLLSDASKPWRFIEETWIASRSANLTTYSVSQNSLFHRMPVRRGLVTSGFIVPYVDFPPSGRRKGVKPPRRGRPPAVINQGGPSYGCDFKTAQHGHRLLGPPSVGSSLVNPMWPRGRHRGSKEVEDDGCPTGPQLLRTGKIFGGIILHTHFG